jgi:hypothetical protein
MALAFLGIMHQTTRASRGEHDGYLFTVALRVMKRYRSSRFLEPLLQLQPLIPAANACNEMPGIIEAVVPMAEKNLASPSTANKARALSRAYLPRYTWAVDEKLKQKLVQLAC